jgi:hypothetical protein
VALRRLELAARRPALYLRAPSFRTVDEHLHVNAPPLQRISYPLLCTARGLIFGWLPWLVHGPIPEKFNVLYIQGSTAVWAYYSARLLVGFVVGISVWPRAWFLRGPFINPATDRSPPR